MAYKILLVEDDPELIEIISDYFTEKSGGALVLDTAKTGEEGMAKCVEHGFDLVLLMLCCRKSTASPSAGN